MMPMVMGPVIRTSRLRRVRFATGLPFGPGFPLRGLRLRCAPPSLRFPAGIPRASGRWRSLRAPLARRLAALPAECRADTVVATFDGTANVTAVSSSPRRFAPRSSRNSLRSPWPAAPAPGFASARRRRTPCVAGAGFAVHRRARTSADTSARALPQPRCARRARAASVPALPPAQTPRRLRTRRLRRRRFPHRSYRRFGRSVPPGAALDSTPDASLMQVRHGRSWLR